MRFLQFALTRAFLAVVTLMTVSLIVFTLMEFVPADCAERYVAFKVTSGQQITEADVQAERIRLGLDQPFLIRWGSWMGGVFFRGDFGESCILRVSINDLLKDKFWISLGIAMTALIVAYLVAVPVGIYAAASHNAFFNNSLRLISYLGLAIPKLPAGADRPADLVLFLRRIAGRNLFERVPRRPLELGQVPGFPVPCLAADLSVGMVGHRVRAADGACADAGRDRQALCHRRRGARGSAVRGCFGGTRRAMRWGR